MAPSIVAVLTIGGLLGLRHAFEPDHLAAVSTLSTRPGGRRLWSAARLGLIWGLGHTVTVGVVPAHHRAGRAVTGALLARRGTPGGRAAHPARDASDVALRARALAYARSRTHRGCPAFSFTQSRR